MAPKNEVVTTDIYNILKTIPYIFNCGGNRIKNNPNINNNLYFNYIF